METRSGRVVVLSRSVALLAPLRRLLRDRGIEVNISDSVETALGLSPQPRPDLIVIEESLSNSAGRQQLQEHFGCPIADLQKRHSKSELRAIATALGLHGSDAATHSDRLKQVVSAQRRSPVPRAQNRFGQAQERKLLAGLRRHLSVARDLSEVSPSLFGTKAIASLVGWGASKIDVEASRYSLNFKASLAKSLAPASLQRQFTTMSRVSHFAGAAAEAMAQAHFLDYTAKLKWSERGRSFQLRLNATGECDFQSRSSNDQPHVSFVFQPAKVSFWSGLVQPADFSLLLEEVRRVSFLAPVPVKVNGQILTLAQAVETYHFPRAELRGCLGASSTSHLLHVHKRDLASVRRFSAPFSQRKAGSQRNAFLFLYAVGGGEEIQRTPTVNWIRQGVVVDKEDLFARKISFNLAIFVCADGLPFDNKSLDLKNSLERYELFEKVKLWTTWSLKTSPPDALLAEPLLREQIRGLFRESKRLFPRVNRPFSNAVKSYGNQQKRFRDQNLAARSLNQRERDPVFVVRWSKFFSCQPTSAQREKWRRENASSSSKQEDLRPFFGGVYLDIGSADKPDP